MQLAGAVCAAVLVLGGAIGASVAMGGGGFVEDVLSTLHIVDQAPGEAEECIDNAPEAADPGRHPTGRLTGL